MGKLKEWIPAVAIISSMIYWAGSIAARLEAVEVKQDSKMELYAEIRERLDDTFLLTDKAVIHEFTHEDYAVLSDPHGVSFEIEIKKIGGEK